LTCTPNNNWFLTSTCTPWRTKGRVSSSLSFCHQKISMWSMPGHYLERMEDFSSCRLCTTLLQD
jgi:hypothetical protein